MHFFAHASNLLATNLLATTWTIWGRPVLPMLIGLAVGVAVLYGLRYLLDSDALPPEMTAVVGGGVALLLAGIAAATYFAAGYTLETLTAVYATGAVLSPFVIYGLLRLVQPKMAVIALTTAQEAMSQPLFWVAIIIGLAAMLAFPFVPYHTFGEDVKVLEDSALNTIMILSIVVALWTASVSIADEIEGKTALTVLSKPVARRDFVLGKFFGISAAVVMIFIILGAAFLISVSYKVDYDATENGAMEPEWTVCWAEMVKMMPGLFLRCMEAIVLTSVSVAISTRLPMLPNLVICATVYVIGHLVPLLVNSKAGSSRIVQFIGTFFATIFPVLDMFSPDAAIAAGRQVPYDYVFWSLVYCSLYCAVMLLVALILFEDRDLA